MAIENESVCFFNKYGFCKFKLTCRKYHNMEICSKRGCEVLKCSLRHPKTCRYHRDIGYCKFGEWCAFKHEHSENKAMEEVYDSRIETIEKNLDQLQKDLSEKDTLIVTLEEKLMYLEEKLKLYEDKIKELDEKIMTK